MFITEDAELIPLSDLPRELGGQLEADHRAQPQAADFEWWPVVGICSSHPDLCRADVYCLCICRTG